MKGKAEVEGKKGQKEQGENSKIEGREFHLHEIPRMGQGLGTECTVVVTRGSGEGKIGELLLNGFRVSV